MKIVILGAGQVGGTLAENLVNEHHDVTLVDIRDSRLNELREQLDIGAVTGHASHPSVLRDAGAAKADMLIAVTASDEINIVACEIAHALFNTPTKIARLRSLEYSSNAKIFAEGNIHIDVNINPEKLVTNYIKELINYPGALQVLSFANDMIKLVALQVPHNSIIIGQQIANLRNYFPNLELRVAAIFRREHLVPITGAVTIETGDELFFLAATKNILPIMQIIRGIDQPYKRVMIAGGGNIGLSIASVLEHDYKVKLIEKNPTHCRYLSESLAKTTVLCGLASDNELLLHENIENMDVFCAVTDDDETNIMTCIQAKRLGVRQTMALISRTAYVDIIEGSDINIAISPQQASISSILAHVRHGDIVDVHSLRRGAAETIEVIAHGDYKTSKVVGRKLQELKLPQGTTIAAIVRNNEVFIPHHDTPIESEDHVILFVADKKYIRKVEKLFQVKISFF